MTFPLATILGLEWYQWLGIIILIGLIVFWVQLRKKQ